MKEKERIARSVVKKMMEDLGVRLGKIQEILSIIDVVVLIIGGHIPVIDGGNHNPNHCQEQDLLLNLLELQKLS